MAEGKGHMVRGPAGGVWPGWGYFLFFMAAVRHSARVVRELTHHQEKPVTRPRPTGREVSGNPGCMLGILAAPMTANDRECPGRCSGHQPTGQGDSLRPSEATIGLGQASFPAEALAKGGVGSLVVEG